MIALAQDNSILTFTTPETRWLSNMTYIDIEYGKLVFPSTENFYQAMKYDVSHKFDGVTNTRKYLTTVKPTEAKAFSRKHKMTNLLFEEKKLEIMLYAQRKKYNQEPFKSKLLATSDALLEEGNWWGDKFWGVDIKTREGENNLGKIIMKVRGELLC